MNNEDTISRSALMERLMRKKCGPANVKYTAGWNDCIMRGRAMVHSAATVPPQVEHGSPCDLCRYSPPSSCDDKPCTMCPAEAKMDGGEDDADN